MSAVWLKVITILCLSCTALSGPALGAGSSGVLWRGLGGTVTIQCKTSSDQDSLYLKKGLKEDYDVLFTEGNPTKDTVAKEFTDRLQSHAMFPNVSILIKNLTSQDTGPYWCVYSKFHPKHGQVITKKDTGSVLLVVTDSTDSMKKCDPASNELVLVSVVISAAVLLGIIIGFFIWIIKTKSSRYTVKPRGGGGGGNDVYEDMRGGTLRR